MTQTQKAKGKAAAADPLPDFDVVLPMTRRAQVAETLRNSILSGRLAPGTQLVESKLASRFGVSRGSVREAIWELIDSGLLVNRPYAGTFVVSLDEKTMTEVYSLRGALERYCFTQLWPKRDETFRKEFTPHTRARQGDRSPEACRRDQGGDEIPQLSLRVPGQQRAARRLAPALAEDPDQLRHEPGDRARRRAFIATSESYIEAALGGDLDKMLREIDRHLELGMIAVEKLMHEKSELNGT